MNSLSSHQYNIPLPSWLKLSNNSKESQRSTRAYVELIWGPFQRYRLSSFSLVLKVYFVELRTESLKRVINALISGVVIDMLFCFLPEKSCDSRISVQLLYAIHHNLLLLPLDILDKYSTFELSQLETHRFLCFAVHRSFRQIFPIF